MRKTYLIWLVAIALVVGMTLNAEAITLYTDDFSTNQYLPMTSDTDPEIISVDQWLSWWSDQNGMLICKNVNYQPEEEYGCIEYKITGQMSDVVIESKVLLNAGYARIYTAYGDTPVYVEQAAMYNGCCPGALVDLNTGNLYSGGIETLWVKIELARLWFCGLAHAAAIYDLTISAGNVGPTADAGADIVADTFADITLDGTGSTDLDGTITSWAWEDSQGNPAGDSSDSSTTTISGICFGFAETYTLTVTDDDGLSDSAEVDVATSMEGLLNLAMKKLKNVITTLKAEVGSLKGQLAGLTVLDAGDVNALIDDAIDDTVGTTIENDVDALIDVALEKYTATDDVAGLIEDIILVKYPELDYKFLDDRVADIEEALSAPGASGISRIRLPKP